MREGDTGGVGNDMKFLIGCHSEDPAFGAGDVGIFLNKPWDYNSKDYSLP